MISVVNMIPKFLSGESNQDSEPNIAVNPSNPDKIAATAFTPDPAGGDLAPIYVSTDGGRSWALNSILPSSAGSATGTSDITLRFAGNGKNLYVSLLNDPTGDLNALRTSHFTFHLPMTVLESRSNLDQPFIQAATVVGGPDSGKDRIYIGINDFNATPQTAVIDQSFDAAVATPSFSTVHIEKRSTGTAGQDGPQVRPAIARDGTIYAAFYGWRQSDASLNIGSDVVVVRDDNWGIGSNPFTALTDPSDGVAGRLVKPGVTFTFNLGPSLGQERTGGDLSIAVDPEHSSIVYLVWADQQPSTGYTLHVRRSTDRGVTWSPNDLRTISNAKNPALTINDDGKLGFLYQQLTGAGANQRWDTQIELTKDRFKTKRHFVLATTPANTPLFVYMPYLGDYDHLMSVRDDFYGIFCANNTPDHSNFPHGVKFQRNANFNTHTLLDLDGTTPVAVSIDPFFFKVTEEDEDKDDKDD